MLATTCGIQINVNITMQYFFYWTYEITSIIQLFFLQFSSYHNIFMVFKTPFQQIFPGFDKKISLAEFLMLGAPYSPNLYRRLETSNLFFRFSLYFVQLYIHYSSIFKFIHQFPNPLFLELAWYQSESHNQWISIEMHQTMTGQPQDSTMPQDNTCGSWCQQHPPNYK